MSLKEELLKLAGLAELESKILNAMRLLENVPEDLKEKEKKLKRNEESLEEKKKQCLSLEKGLSLLTTELNESKERTKSRETRLYEIKTAKEYQAATKEISETKKLNTEREIRFSQNQEKLEHLREEVLALEEEVNAFQKNIEEEQNRLQEEQLHLKTDLEAYQKSKQEVICQLDGNLIEHYERIIVRRQPAVAPVKAGVCQECNMNIPPRLYIEIQKFQEVISCPSCHRILFIPQE